MTTIDRASFETYIDSCIESEAGLEIALHKDGFGDYCVPWVASKWSAWCAALQSQQAAAEPLIGCVQHDCAECKAMEANRDEYQVEADKLAMENLELRARLKAFEDLQPVAWTVDMGLDYLRKGMGVTVFPDSEGRDVPLFTWEKL